MELKQLTRYRKVSSFISPLTASSMTICADWSRNELRQFCRDLTVKPFSGRHRNLLNILFKENANEAQAGGDKWWPDNCGARKKGKKSKKKKNFSREKVENAFKATLFFGHSSHNATVNRESIDRSIKKKYLYLWRSHFRARFWASIAIASESRTLFPRIWTDYGMSRIPATTS